MTVNRSQHFPGPANSLPEWQVTSLSPEGDGNSLWRKKLRSNLAQCEMQTIFGWATCNLEQCSADSTGRQPDAKL